MVLPNGGCYVGAFEKDRFHGPGTHEYPDKSCYIGDWADGKKHGGGTYWDKHGGCMAGSWEKGVLKGSAVYQQAGYKLAASYTKGIPDGDCAFTIAAFRKIHAREICCAHITAPSGPVLNHGGTYSIPPGPCPCACCQCVTLPLILAAVESAESCCQRVCEWHAVIDAGLFIGPSCARAWS